MQDNAITFSVTPFRRLLGRSPLLRGVDRLESLVAVVLATLCLAFLAVAAAVGTSFYDERSRAYAAEAQTCYTVTATAIEDSAVIAQPNTVINVAVVEWNAAGSNHVDEFAYDDRLKAGDRITIWVNAEGNRIVAPPTRSRASAEAVGVAALIWSVVLVGAGTLMYAVHRRLDGIRYRRWDREFDALAGDGGGRTKRSQ